MPGPGISCMKKRTWQSAAGHPCALCGPTMRWTGAAACWEGAGGTAMSSGCAGRRTEQGSWSCRTESGPPWKGKAGSRKETGWPTGVKTGYCVSLTAAEDACTRRMLPGDRSFSGMTGKGGCPRSGRKTGHGSPLPTGRTGGLPPCPTIRGGRCATSMRTGVLRERKGRRGKDPATGTGRTTAWSGWRRPGQDTDPGRGRTGGAYPGGPCRQTPGA